LSVIFVVLYEKNQSQFDGENRNTSKGRLWEHKGEDWTNLQEEVGPER
jgi:hypothetical protein